MSNIKLENSKVGAGKKLGRNPGARSRSPPDIQMMVTNMSKYCPKFRPNLACENSAVTHTGVQGPSKGLVGLIRDSFVFVV